MVFPVVMYGCERWTLKKAESQRIDAFELWCWRRLLRVPWTARRSNQSILKEIGPGCSLEGLILKLKFQHFGYLMRRTDSLEKTLILGKIESVRRRRRQRMRWLDGITDSIDMNWENSRSWWWTGRPGVLQSMGSQRVGHDWLAELNWTKLVCNCTKMTLVRADCFVSACSPLPQPIKALAPWMSGKGESALGQVPFPQPPTAGIQDKANFPFHQLCLSWLLSSEQPDSSFGYTASYIL